MKAAVKRGAGWKSLIASNFIFLILILLVIAMSIATPNFLSVSNIINIVRQVAVTGTIAYGMTMIIITGGIDLSAGSVIALAGVVAASFANVANGGNALLAVAAAVGVAVVCGVVNGAFVAHVGIPAFIVTLGMQQAARGFALIYTDGRTISDFSPAFNRIGQGTIGVVPVPIIIYLALGVVIHVILKHTRLGKHIYAIGGSEQSAIVCGINVKRVKVIIYAIMGVLIGVASCMMVSRISSGNPSSGVNYEFDAITATVIGGASLSGGSGTIIGTVIGSLLVGVVNTGLSLLGVSVYWQQIVKGALIVAAVVLDRYKYKFAG